MFLNFCSRLHCRTGSQYSFVTHEVPLREEHFNCFPRDIRTNIIFTSRLQPSDSEVMNIFNTNRLTLDALLSNRLYYAGNVDFQNGFIESIISPSGRSR